MAKTILLEAGKDYEPSNGKSSDNFSSHASQEFFESEQTSRPFSERNIADILGEVNSLPPVPTDVGREIRNVKKTVFGEGLYSYSTDSEAGTVVRLAQRVKEAYVSLFGNQALSKAQAVMRKFDTDLQAYTELEETARLRLAKAQEDMEQLRGYDARIKADFTDARVYLAQFEQVRSQHRQELGKIASEISQAQEYPDLLRFLLHRQAEVQEETRDVEDGMEICADRIIASKETLDRNKGMISNLAVEIREALSDYHRIKLNTEQMFATRSYYINSIGLAEVRHEKRKLDENLADHMDLLDKAYARLYETMDSIAPQLDREVQKNKKFAEQAEKRHSRREMTREQKIAYAKGLV